jgi:hypothetical protein
VAGVTVLFCLPRASPVTVGTMNYASIAHAVVLVLTGVWWYVARRSHGTPTTAAYGSDRDQAELAEGIVRSACRGAGPGANWRAGYGRMSERAVAGGRPARAIADPGHRAGDK